MLRGGGAPGVPSMEASLNAQIEDLVQRNRTLEHTNKKLLDEMALDSDHTKKVAREFKAEHQEDRRLWREGCNRLLSCHHLAHLRLSAKLSSAEASLLKEMELSRQEKVARLHRDFQITMFRIREGELEAKVEELEEALQEAQHGHYSQFSELEERIKAQDEEIGSLNQEKATAENELTQLRESYGRLQVTAESANTRLERMTLQFEGAQTTSAELERQNDELKRTSADIKRQLDRWQNLETKGGEEVETLRKQRMDLEVEVKALGGRLEKKEGELQKARDKVKKYKENIDEFEAHIEEQRQDGKDVANQLARAQKEIERLELELDAERAARPISPLKQRKPSPTVSENEIANDFAEPPPPSSPPVPPSKKPRSKSASSKNGRNKPAPEMVAGPFNASDSDIEEVPAPKARSRTKAKAPSNEVNRSRKPKVKPRSRTAGRDNSESEDEVRATNNKGKGKAKVVEEVHDSDSDVAPSRPKTASRAKRKREDDTRSEVSELPDRGKSKARSKVSRAGSIQPRGTTVVSDDESDPPAKKKKRTIGLFPANSQLTSFNFLQPAGDTGGLDIPTVLSPIRESDVVPSRSTIPRTGSSTSVLGSLGGMLSSFGRRR
ncbi:hypothetical protein C8R43DRAFT_980483 [Mycena crocata]|nr:hypothetical protein C8R43DRAFT_980483 [Mycena crocata]